MEESPQALKVFKRIISILEERSLERLKTSKSELEIYRSQGAISSLKSATEILRDIEGN